MSYFENKGHKLFESAPLVPINDDSLLWVNAGVTPLKKYFDGTVVPECKRLTSIQKCIRTNDIENVGITRRHQTFFEMMGNFSIGDYFRNEAIEFSMELLTSDKWFGIPREKLYVTIYPSDTESYNKWIEVGMIKDHIIKLEENFWEIGAGPCGPDTEIFYFRSNDEIPDKFDPEDERWVEIWNNVFMQFNKDSEGNITELPKKNVDTGMGFERLCMALQNKKSNYDTDVFTGMITKISELCGKPYTPDNEVGIAIRVIADHIRAISFSIADGQLPSNVKAGYVIRRILRRAVRYGYTFLDLKEPFLCKLVAKLVEEMGESYPEIAKQQKLIEDVVKNEEEAFLRTLDKGIILMNQIMKKSEESKVISGSDAFTLYDTFGFPIDLSELIARENGYSIDFKGFEEELNKQKERARSATAKEAGDWVVIEELPQEEVNYFTEDDLLGDWIEESRDQSYYFYTDGGSLYYSKYYEGNQHHGHAGFDDSLDYVDMYPYFCMYWENGVLNEYDCDTGEWLGTYHKQ